MFNDFSTDHLQLNDFGYGPTSDIGTSKNMSFPYLWVTHSQASSIVISNKTQIPEMSLTFIIVDQINNQKNYLDVNGNNSNNTQEIMSDMFQVAQDFIGYIITDLNKYGVKVMDESMGISPVMDETTDKVSGWSLDLRLKIVYSNCDYPIKSK